MALPTSRYNTFSAKTPEDPAEQVKRDALKRRATKPLKPLEDTTSSEGKVVDQRKKVGY